MRPDQIGIIVWLVGMFICFTTCYGIRLMMIDVRRDKPDTLDHHLAFAWISILWPVLIVVVLFLAIPGCGHLLARAIYYGCKYLFLRFQGRKDG